MDENKQQESAQEPVKAELPTPTFTETSAVKPTSTVEPEVLARQVAELLKPDIEKAVQSTKDRRFDRLERSLSQLAELEAAGAVIPDSVKQEARIRDYVDSKLNSAPMAQESVREPKFDAASVLKEVGLDGNNADVIRLLQGQYRNPDHFRAEAQSLRLRQLTPTPQSGGGAPAMQEGGPVGGIQESDEDKYKRIFGTPKSPFDLGNLKKMLSEEDERGMRTNAK